jgi:hypothetical protein
LAVRSEKNKETQSERKNGHVEKAACENSIWSSVRRGKVSADNRPRQALVLDRDIFSNSEGVISSGRIERNYIGRFRLEKYVGAITAARRLHSYKSDDTVSLVRRKDKIAVCLGDAENGKYTPKETIRDVSKAAFRWPDFAEIAVDSEENRSDASASSQD